MVKEFVDKKSKSSNQLKEDYESDLQKLRLDLDKKRKFKNEIIELSVLGKQLEEF